MKFRFLSLLLMLAFGLTSYAQNDYYFPDGSTFDSSIPEPRDVLKYDVGDFHTRIDLMIKYMEELAASSDKATLQTIGYTNEMRPQVVLTITSPQNHAKLDEIRTEHLKFSNPAVADPTSTDLPVVVLLGYNVHGNEPSSTEAAMLAAYYLIASTNDETTTFLNDAIIHIDPAYNPDGRDRHSTWANTYHGFPIVDDPLDREHNENWPRGRTNHYWFDLNRDWLPLAQIESRNRIEFYHKWLPNVVTDYHEMGSNSTYFFEPTEPFGSENPIVPRSNYDRLNNLFAEYYEDALEDINSLYFTEEQYDNSYPGYGSTYPDIHGGLGMVFEQASSRGHAQMTQTGKQITFPFTIRNHLRTSIATVRASVENKDELMFHQSTFFKDAQAEGNKSSTKAYVFGDEKDLTRTRKFADLLLQHRIKVYEVSGSLTAGGKRFVKGAGYIVPSDQPQYKMVKTMFEPVKSFYDSVFYDASAWTVALGFGLPYERVNGKAPAMGNEISRDDLKPAPTTVERSNYSYLIDWSDYNAPKALHQLQSKGVVVRGARVPFTSRLLNGASRDFGAGTLLINLGDQSLGEDEVYNALTEVSKNTGLAVFSTNNGRTTKGPDLGSSNMAVLQAPKLLMIIGGSASSYEAGEVWHLMDQRVGMPITKIYHDHFSRVNLNNYTTLILVSGNYSGLGENNINKIKEWVRGGGTVIAQRSAVSWAIRAKLVGETLKSNQSGEQGRTDYALQREVRGSRSIGGSIYMTDVDITHPIGYGLTNRSLPAYRNHSVFLNPSKSPYNTVSLYTNNPHLDGYIHPESLKMVKGSASVVSSPSGRGRYILFADNPNFRGYWYGTNRLFFNAIFYGGTVY